MTMCKLNDSNIRISLLQFQVEYKDYASGEPQVALAEAPNEALPLSCRPNFGAAWLIKDKFKVGDAKLLVSV